MAKQGDSREKKGDTLLSMMFIDCAGVETSGSAREGLEEGELELAGKVVELVEETKEVSAFISGWLSPDRIRGPVFIGLIATFSLMSRHREFFTADVCSLLCERLTPLMSDPSANIRFRALICLISLRGYGALVDQEKIAELLQSRCRRNQETDELIISELTEIGLLCR